MRIERKYINWFIASVVLYFAYYFVYYISISKGKIDFANVIIFSLSMLIVMIGVHRLKDGMTISSLFMVAFFCTLSFNNLNLSYLQDYKSLKDIYFFFAGPLFFIICTSLRFKGTVKSSKFGINILWVTTMIFAVHLLAQSYIFGEAGVRFLSNDWLSLSSYKYVIPGISGIVDITRWLCLMFFCETKNKYLKWLIVISLIVFAGLNAKRGDIMRILFFLGIWYFYGREKTIKNIKMKVLMICLIGCVALGILGNYRQAKRGWEKGQLSLMAESVVDNDFLVWTYTYSAINFDVLKAAFIDGEYNSGIGLDPLMTPVIRLTGGSNAVLEHSRQYETKGLKGFNASTFLGVFIRDAGYFYIIGVVILGIILSFFESLCLSNGWIGGHVFLLLLTVLAIFGNYYVNVSYVYAFFLYVFLQMIVCSSSTSIKEDRAGK